jgi:hypothetical protein
MWSWQGSWKREAKIILIQGRASRKFCHLAWGSGWPLQVLRLRGGGCRGPGQAGKFYSTWWLHLCLMLLEKDREPRETNLRNVSALHNIQNSFLLLSLNVKFY